MLARMGSYLSCTLLTRDPATPLCRVGECLFRCLVPMANAIKPMFVFYCSDVKRYKTMVCVYHCAPIAMAKAINPMLCFNSCAPIAMATAIKPKLF